MLKVNNYSIYHKNSNSFGNANELEFFKSTILRLLNEGNSISAISRKINKTTNWVTNAVHHYGELTNHEKKALNLTEKIKKLHKLGKNIDGISEYTQLSQYSINEILKNENPNPIKIFKEIEDNILRMFDEGQNVNKIAYNLFQPISIVKQILNYHKRSTEDFMKYTKQIQDKELRIIINKLKIPKEKLMNSIKFD